MKIKSSQFVWPLIKINLIVKAKLQNKIGEKKLAKLGCVMLDRVRKTEKHMWNET